MQSVVQGIFTLIIFIFGLGCGGPGGPNVTLTLKGASSGLGVSDARLVFVSTSGKTQAYETDPDGLLAVSLSPGTYDLHVQSTGIYSIPDDPYFSIEIKAPVSGLSDYLLELPSVSGAGSMGWLDVRVKTDSGSSTLGALVVAEGVGLRNSKAPVSFAYSDSAGLARVPNLPEGDYSIKVYGQGLYTTQVQSASVVAGQGSSTEIKVHEEGLVDVTIEANPELPTGASVEFFDPLTGQPVPGLEYTTGANSGLMESLAPGTYGVRINDEGWALSPDSLAREGMVDVKVLSSGSASLTLDAKETTKIVSPSYGATTNKNPTFNWVSQAMVDFYVVEVRDQSREIVYGGFAGDGTPRLMIPNSVTSLNYGNLDHLTPGVAAQYVPNETLKTGKLYRWRVFGCVDDASAPKGYHAVTVSHFRAGVFSVESDP
jgi:hypothetical protein